MDIRQAIAFLGSLENTIQMGASDGVDDLTDFGVQTAQEFSSGNESSAALARADHPYAKRHGSPRRAPHIINKQRGVFFEAWMAARKSERDWQIINDSDVADFLRDGTATMFERPIDDAVEFVMEQNGRIVENAIRARVL